MEALFRQTPFNPEGKLESVQNLYARYNDLLSANGNNCGVSVLPRPSV